MLSMRAAERSRRRTPSAGSSYLMRGAIDFAFRDTPDHLCRRAICAPLCALTLSAQRDAARAAYASAVSRARRQQVQRVQARGRW